METEKSVGYVERKKVSTMETGKSVGYVDRKKVGYVDRNLSKSRANAANGYRSSRAGSTMRVSWSA